MQSLADRVVIVTGAKGGLGTHVSLALLGAGAQVVGSSRKIDDAEFHDPRFAGIPADLTHDADARKLVETVIQRFGRIDALAHVAGGFAGGSPIHETSDATWDGMMSLNVTGAFHILRAVIPHMRSARRGRIVAIGSRAALEPAATISAYSASKAALVSLMHTAALENRDLGITANVILPGTIDTEANRKMDPQADRSKWVSPEKLAELVVFLVSDAAAEITGAAIPFYGAGL
jgi:NAD(P)-dependent dehydrogenase (short-subunit alcohol dehydrogenase family)